METNNIDAVAFEYLKGTNACKYVRRKGILRTLLYLAFALWMGVPFIYVIVANKLSFNKENMLLIIIWFVAVVFLMYITVANMITFLFHKEAAYVKFATIENVYAKGEDKSYSGTNGHKRVNGETIEFYADCKDDNGKMHEYCVLAERGFKCHNHIEVSACERSMMKNMEEFVGKTKDLYKGDKVIVFKFDTKEKGKHDAFGCYFIKYKA